MAHDVKERPLSPETFVCSFLQADSDPVNCPKPIDYFMIIVFVIEFYTHQIMETLLVFNLIHLYNAVS